MGNGISEGAIVQHLSKLRTKMKNADMDVPPTLRRGIIAKEPSKIYASSNGKKLPPPVFAAPRTPDQTKSKKKATLKSQTTPQANSKIRIGKGKRRRSELYDSDEDPFDEYAEDSDEEYGTAKKKTRASKPKVKEYKVSAGKSDSQKSKVLKADLNAAATKEINQDIMRTLQDWGPASRTRHVKLDFSNLNQNLINEEEEEEDEEAEGGDGEAVEGFEMPTTYSPVSIKEEHSVSPHTEAPSSKVDVMFLSSQQ